MVSLIFSNSFILTLKFHLILDQTYAVKAVVKNRLNDYRIFSNEI